MGNELQKQYNIKQKPLKLPGSYNFLKFIQHPTEKSSLIIVKHPHRATSMSSTLILPIRSIKQLSQSMDAIAICNRCLPLCLVKPKSETQMKILMHKILKSSTQIGRCFLSSGRVMLWCEEKRGIASMAPEEVQHAKSHEKSTVFISGISLINFLYCVYDSEATKIDTKKNKKENNKSSFNKQKKSLIDKNNQKADESLPIQIKLFFQPKDKKQYFEMVENMRYRLQNSTFWTSISPGLRELLLNMIDEEPSKRIDLHTILSIPYFNESPQLRIYDCLADDLESLSAKQAKIFLTTLELIVKEGLTIEKCILDNFIIPVICSNMLFGTKQDKENDFISAYLNSILIELDVPPLELIVQAFKKSHSKNKNMIKLALNKRNRLHSVLSPQDFDSIFSRAIFCSFESIELIGSTLAAIPFAMQTIKQVNLRKEIEFLLISKVLMMQTDKNSEDLLVDGLKCMIFLLKNKLVTSAGKLDGLKYQPVNLSIETNFHILYLYGLIIQSVDPRQLLSLMIPKLELFLKEPDIFDQIFMVSKRCVQRILDRLTQQRKIHNQNVVLLDKGEEFFQMKNQSPQQALEERKDLIKKEIEKYQLEKLRWTIKML